MKPQLIESAEQMTELLQQLSTSTLIAVDTEFQRETSYYPKLALVQIATESIVACVDPLAFDARPSLKKLLLDNEITKVFHACSQDMEVLFYYLGAPPTSIYDTQIAHGFMSDHHQIGYAGLVEEELGVSLDKSQTRTNWLQRPLTDKQIQYAGDDVYYLFQLHEIMQTKLLSQNKEAWFLEECSSLCGNENYAVDTESLWKRVKGTNKLSRETLAVIQSIAVWREQQAQQYDKTRRRILSDDHVIQLALNTENSTAAIQQIIASGKRSDIKITDSIIDEILHAIEQGHQCSEENWPDNRFSLLDNEQKSLLKSLQKVVAEKSETLGIASALFCARKDLEKLIILNSQSNNEKMANLPLLNGWRKQCIGDSLLQKLSQSPA